jgi:hypothetical protein
VIEVVDVCVCADGSGHPLVRADGGVSDIDGRRGHVGELQEVVLDVIVDAVEDQLPVPACCDSGEGELGSCEVVDGYHNLALERAAVAHVNMDGLVCGHALAGDDVYAQEALVRDLSWGAVDGQVQVGEGAGDDVELEVCVVALLYLLL